MNSLSESFENHILDNLKKCGCDIAELSARGLSLGAAVSGGADSVCLLLCLAELCRKSGCSLKVITVNHRIRSEAESSGDALFVRDLCRRLLNDGLPVSFFLYELKPGEVGALSEKRKNGIEEAARFLRYKAFSEFSQKENVPFVCLAHNQNDQIETLVMRFLQGSAGTSGIRPVRGVFIRPLLDVTRGEIEAYLTERGEFWRTDSTNFDEHYMRNRIRRSVVPFLDGKFPGWKKSVLGGSIRAELDEDFFENECSKVVPLEETEKSVSFDRNAFQKVHPAVSSRVILRSVSKISPGIRIPFYLVKNILDLLCGGSESGCVESHGVVICFDKSRVYVKIKEFIATDSCFFAIIEKSGDFQFPFGTVFVQCSGKTASAAFKSGAVLENIPVPFCIRSRQADDRVKTVSGGTKSVSDVLSDCHIPAELKAQVPVVQELATGNQEIRAVVASVFGYTDWIVRT